MLLSSIVMKNNLLVLDVVWVFLERDSYAEQTKWAMWQILTGTLVAHVFSCYYTFDFILQEVEAALDRFSSYHHVWRKDREDTLQKYFSMRE